MATLQELYNWTSAQGRGVSAAEAAAALGDTEVHVQQIFTAKSPPNGTAFIYDPGANLYSATPGWVDAPPPPATAADDMDALNALAGAVCAAGECTNDVDLVLGVSGVSPDAWARGNGNINSLVDMLRCANLRSKLAQSGLDLAKLDGLLDSCDVAMTANDAMLAHYGQAGV